MGSPRASHARTEPPWAATRMAAARDHECDLLRAAGRGGWRLLPNDLPPRSTVYRCSRSGATLEIVRKPADQIGFAVHPRQWVVELTSAPSRSAAEPLI